MFSQEYDKDELWLLKEKYQGVESQEFLVDCERLAVGEPLAYLIGHIPFLDTTIYLDSRPLIPRVETEYWINFLINTWKKDTSPHTILDLCAGSGAIGVALGKHFEEAQVDFAELDPLHLPTIRKNCLANGIAPERTNFFVSDLFISIEKSYDLIVSNPPYIDTRLERTEASVLNYEPHLALFAKENGFALLKKIIDEATKHLNPKGELWLEHEPEHTTLIKTEVEEKYHITTHKDQYGCERFSRLVLK